jgi:hypothetical protein
MDLQEARKSLYSVVINNNLSKLEEILSKYPDLITVKFNNFDLFHLVIL